MKNAHRKRKNSIKIPQNHDIFSIFELIKKLSTFKQNSINSQ